MAELNNILCELKGVVKKFETYVAAVTKEANGCADSDTAASDSAEYDMTIGGGSLSSPFSTTASQASEFDFSYLPSVATTTSIPKIRKGDPPKLMGQPPENQFAKAFTHRRAKEFLTMGLSLDDQSRVNRKNTMDAIRFKYTFIPDKTIIQWLEDYLEKKKEKYLQNGGTPLPSERELFVAPPHPKPRLIPNHPFNALPVLEDDGSMQPPIPAEDDVPVVTAVEEPRKKVTKRKIVKKQKIK